MVMKLVSVHFVHNVHVGKGGGRVVGTFLDNTYMIETVPVKAMTLYL